MATVQNYEPMTAEAQGYNAATAQAQDWNVDDKQLVQNQVQGIVAKDSPLMQQAATTAKQGMAQRGLLNSSMAVGAGQNAVIAQALPMAQQDAATQANAAQFNAQNRTNIDLQNAAMGNDASRFAAESGNQMAQFNAQQQNQFGLAGLQQQSELERMAKAQQYDVESTELQFQLDTQQKVRLAELSSAAAERLANIEAAYKNLNQLSASTASVMNTTMQSIARVMEDSTLDAAAKQKAIGIYNANAETSLNLLASMAGDVDLQSFFDRLEAS